MILKDSLWVEFAKDEKAVSTGQSLEREAFFSQLGRCVSQCSIKGVKPVRCRGKITGYKGMQSKQVVMAIHRVAEEKYVKTNPCENEQGDDAEREEPGREDGIVGHNDSFSPMKNEQVDSDRGKMLKRKFKSVHSTIISLRKDDDEGSSVGHDVSPKLDGTQDENSQPSEDNRAKEDSLGRLHEDIKCQERDEDDKKGIQDKTRKTPLSCSLDEGLDSAEKQKQTTNGRRNESPCRQ